MYAACMPTAPHFTPAFFRFLKGLANNNSREWFLAHKGDYEADVKAPMLRFITDLQPRMAKVSPRIDVDPKLVGGSMQRMNRDTRFSKDKSPYKTNVGAMFGHAAAGDLMLGYHLTLAPGAIKAYVGLWEPEGPTLEKVRAGIIAKPDEWKKAIGGKFAATHTFEGESLKRPPSVGGRAINPDHPLINDLKRKSHAAAATFDEKAACAPDYLDRYIEAVKVGSPMMTFLCGTLKVPY